MANDLRGKTFTVVHKTHFSLELFHSALDHRGHHVPYAANDPRGKLLQLAKKP